MPIELVGQQIRYARYTKAYQRKHFKRFRVHDVGRPSYLQRLSAVRKTTGEWVTLGWRINLAKYKTFTQVMKAIRQYIPSPYKRKALMLARRWWKKHKGETTVKRKRKGKRRLRKKMVLAAIRSPRTPTHLKKALRKIAKRRTWL